MDDMPDRAGPDRSPVPDPDGDVESERLSVGDPETMKTRLLSRQCPTCVFKPGNLMKLRHGRLHDLIAQARAAESYIVCHSTLPGMAPAGILPAVCRGFADSYSTQSLQLIERLFGFDEVDPPGTTD